MGVVKRFLGFDDPRAWTPFSLSALRPTVSGVSVDEGTALTQATVYDCVKMVSEDIAAMPFILYKRLQEGKDRATEHPLFTLLHDAPNPVMAAMTFWEIAIAHGMLWGNFYAEIQRDNVGRVVALWPLRPDRTAPKQIIKSEMVYETKLANGETKFLSGDLVFHVVGFGTSGFQGLSPITLHRETIGEALAQQEYGNRYFVNDASVPFFLVSPTKLSDKARENLTASWEKRHQGLEKKHRIGILEQGVDIKTVGISPVDSQYLESRNFIRTEIAGIWRIPPHKVADLSRATFANVEHLALEYKSDALRPPASRVEKTILTKLLSEAERKTYFAEFLFDDLMSTDTVSRYTAYNIARYGGWMNADQICSKENMNPLPDGQGKIYWAPKNFGDLAQFNSPLAVAESSPPPPARSESRSLTESDKRKMALYKMNVANSFKPVIEDAVRRTTSKEVKDLKALAKKAADVGMFMESVDKYYLDREEILIRDLTPSFTSLAEAILAITAEEVKGLYTMTLAMRECLNEHILHTCRYNALGAKNTVLKAVREAREMTFEEFELEAMLEGWILTRPEIVAAWETTRISGLMSNANYFAAGADGVEWVTLDLEDERCAKLDFMENEFAGSCNHRGFSEGYHRREFEPSWKVSTPPLYLGCTCQLVPYWRKP